ncbi:MAG TPA: trypsin-like peptidase domain-containing protein, partial [Bryobacteraceae bacterium]|nr:trypsin-like peptidase domain-containing protein [Bryobacteraceae bacterium]
AVRGPRLRTGIHRQIPAGAVQSGAWQTAPDGTPLWRAAVRSPGALGIRVEFRDFSVGDGTVWVYDGAQFAGPYSGRGPYHDGHFWSDTVASESVVLEYQPAGAPGGEPPFQIANIAHQTRLAMQPAAGPAPAPPQPDYCQLDPNCYPDWKPAMSMVGILDFEDGGDEYVCSGSLVATRDNSMKPYLLTAGHCVNNEAVARTVEVYWKYQTSACGATPPATFKSGEASPQGAHLIGAGTIAQGDYSLLLLQSVPSDVTFSGWDTTDPQVSSLVTGVHHPLGSWKRISFGKRTGDETVKIVNESGGFDTAPANLFLQIQYDQGRPQPGSSGSPAFTSPGVIVGTLTEGPESDVLTACEIVPFVVGYGRFSNTYQNLQAYFEDWPAATVAPAPASLNFSVVNKAAPAAQTVQLTSGTTGRVAFQIRPDALWIGASVASGQISAASPVAVKISVDPSQLPQPGQYAGTVTILAGSAAPQFINVTATVQAAQSNVSAVVAPATVVAANGVWSFTMQLTETGGAATSLTALKINGTDYSAYMAQWFGTNHLAALGTIQAPLQASGVPGGPQYFEFWGVDDVSGQTWYRVASATFQ